MNSRRLSFYGLNKNQQESHHFLHLEKLSNNKEKNKNNGKNKNKKEEEIECQKVVQKAVKYFLIVTSVNFLLKTNSTRCKSRYKYKLRLI